MWRKIVVAIHTDRLEAVSTQLTRLLNDQYESPLQSSSTYTLHYMSRGVNACLSLIILYQN
jgi:hypothetical protein